MACRGALPGLAGAIALACGAPDSPSQPAPAIPTNVLLVTVDTLRADHLGSYGYPRPTSPAIDRLAAEGALFEAAMAPRSQTWPSLTSLLTSRQPVDHGVRRNGQARLAGVRGLPERLADAGYQTAAFLSNMLTAEHPGFERVERCGGPTHDWDVTERAVTWLRSRDQRPFFAWVHYFAPHHPYAPPASFAEAFFPGDALEFTWGHYGVLARITLARPPVSRAQLGAIVALYDGEVAFADAQAGRLLAELDRLGLAERTLVVFASDHGEELFQRNHYFFHDCSIYDSTLHVPLILRRPGSVPAGLRVPGVVELVDVAPTVLELLGLAVPAEFAGRSLTPRLDGTGAARSGVAYAEIEDDIHSLRTSRWRYVANPRGIEPDCPPFRGQPRGYSIEREELYDLASDPAELSNVVQEHPGVAAELAARLLRWTAAHGAPVRDTILAPETAAELRALGYIE